MYKYSITFLILVLLLGSCDNASQRRKHNNNSPVQTEQLSIKKQQKKPLQFKKGEEYSVKVVGVADGDTFTGLTADNLQVKCRIYGIDAPEKKQAFGNRSKQTLSDLIFGEQVRIKIQNKDRYGRAIVWVFTAEGIDVSAEMLRVGMAWHFKKYDNSIEYVELDSLARIRQIGLWSDKNPVAPWNYRQSQKYLFKPTSR